MAEIWMSRLTTAFFLTGMTSEASDELKAGQYAGTVTTTTTVRSDDPTHPSTNTTSSKQDARALNATFGGANVALVQERASGYVEARAWANPTPSLRDYKNVAIGIALSACLVGEPCGAFAAGGGIIDGTYELYESLK